ncbi:hypothetical protein MKW98_011094 [Papaver atlanticum]|uniref:Uncharacterized protein n=1 Tax=Papaver atlanticum TaxID=357466 RepID=A0AAD4XY82_9MAGN|nr:hypothetical protein MKW98_011094 [Papaver atlanticum]
MRKDDGVSLSHWIIWPEMPDVRTANGEPKDANLVLVIRRTSREKIFNIFSCFIASVSLLNYLNMFLSLQLVADGSEIRVSIGRCDEQISKYDAGMNSIHGELHLHML